MTTPSRDLDAYLHLYTTRTAIQRLLHVAETYPPWTQDARRLALKLVREQTQDTELYTRLSNLLLAIPGTDPWILQIQFEWSQRLDALQRRQQDLIQGGGRKLKEELRQSYLDLAAHFLAAGAMTESQRALLKAREYGTSHQQGLEVHLLLLKTALSLKQFSWLNLHLAKAESLLQHLIEGKGESSKGERDQLDKVKHELICLRALTFLNPSDFRPLQLARCFFGSSSSSSGVTSLTSSGSSSHSSSTLLKENDDEGPVDLLASSDIALYVLLCALASMDRQEVLQHLHHHQHFFEDKSDPTVRHFILNFQQARYADLQTLLQQIELDAQLDPYLAPHITDLIQRVQEQMLTQRLLAFNRINLSSLNDEQNTQQEKVEVQVVRMLLDGNPKLSGYRVAQSVEGGPCWLVAGPEHEEQQRQRWLQSSRQHERRLKGLHLRAQMVAEGLVVGLGKGPSSS